MEGDLDMSENNGTDEIKITLFSNYILADIVPKKKTKILIPETVKKPLGSEDFNVIIVKISEERDEDGKPLVRHTQVGDNVCLSAASMHTGQVVKMHQKEYFLVRETEVVGIFHEGYDQPIANLEDLIVSAGDVKVN